MSSRLSHLVGEYLNKKKTHNNSVKVSTATGERLEEID
jgi:hypothetical protein